MPAAPASAIGVTATAERLEGRLIARLPADVSAVLSSRGQSAAVIRLGAASFVTVIEPDGRRGHWIDLAASGFPILTAGESLSLTLTPTKDWPEVVVPSDLGTALTARGLAEVWGGLTPMARWEWVRWVKATKNPHTRARRVEVTASKLENGKRRPCCFNLTSCTDPELSRNGKLLGLT